MQIQPGADIAATAPREVRRRATSAERLVWLDLTRLLCALLILGIHWLRAAYKVGLFGAGEPVDLVINYQGQERGLGMLPFVLIAGTSHSLGTWLTNLVGVFGGFGWEGVSALVIVSGFSLTMALRSTTPRGREWFGWLRKRLVRILVPFYLVALPFLIGYAVLLGSVAHAHGAFARGLADKLHSMLQTPPLGVVLSHTLLFDPFERQWQADFFAPAWWFIPAILLAYLAFPMMLGVARRIGRIAALGAAAAVTLIAYQLVAAGVLVNEAWYYIVLQENFNLMLGIVAGLAWLDPRGRPLLERIVFARASFALAFLAFAAGNIANWSSATRPFASMLYGPGLLVMVTVIAKAWERSRVARLAGKVDAYDLYLVHQPFAFPLALAAKIAFHGYAVFIGWFVFVAVAAVAAAVLAALQRLVFRQRKPGAVPAR